MAHNLSQREDGTYEAIFSGDRQDVWHGLGTYVGGRALTAEEARNVVGIPVEKVPVTYERPIGNGDTVATVSKKAFLTVRTDNGKELAMVGPQYTVTPFGEALVDNLLPVIDAGLGDFDVAGLLAEGLMGWVMLKWNSEKLSGKARETFGREGVSPYTLFFAAHGEGQANVGRNTYIRGVCANTVGMILSRAAYGFTVAHRTNARDAQLSKTRELFSGIIAEHETVAAAYETLRNLRLSRQEFKSLILDVAAPMPTLAEGEEKSARFDLMVERRKEMRQRIFSMWADGTGHTGDGSAWEAYNGLVEILDHETDGPMFRTRGQENRVVSLMSGPLAKVRESVFSSLMKFAAERGKVSLSV